MSVFTSWVEKRIWKRMTKKASDTKATSIGMADLGLMFGLAGWQVPLYPFNILFFFVGLFIGIKLGWKITKPIMTFRENRINRIPMLRKLSSTARKTVTAFGMSLGFTIGALLFWHYLSDGFFSPFSQFTLYLLFGLIGANIIGLIIPFVSLLVFIPDYKLGRHILSHISLAEIDRTESVISSRNIMSAGRHLLGISSSSDDPSVRDDENPSNSLLVELGFMAGSTLHLHNL